MSVLELALLGAPIITLDDEPIKTDRRKAIALLVYLAVTGKPQRRDALAGLLWPDYDQSSAFAYLRRTIWEINQTLGKGWLIADRDSVNLIRSSKLWLDTEEFTELTIATEPLNLEAAVELYRGDFLSGFIVQDTAPFETWQTEQSASYRRKFSGVLEKLIAGYEQNGEFEKALVHARRFLSLDTLNEAAHRAMMRNLVANGDRTGALRQYETAVKALQVELGVAPQDETIELAEAIRRGAYQAARHLSGAETGFKRVTAQRKEARSRDNLPVPPTPFIGRRPELDQIRELILSPQNRLITLVGPGGTGKTRLSIESARETTHAFTDGVWFVPLAPLHSADGIVAAIAKALDFTFYNEQESPKQQLLEYLREKQLLLVLDNFEHLLTEGSVGIVTELLTTSKNAKILVTSRERLNIGSEQLFRVSGMRTPELGSVETWEDPETQAKPFSAVQLFIDRARRLQPDFKLTGENLGAVTTICSLVRGMPLGIELASSWLELLSPEEIVKEISRSLDFLETDQADVPERQRSIRAVFESSWKMLSKEEQAAFKRLTVFRGGFTREAGVFVAETSLRTLLGLVNKSWLQRGEKDRFQVHELLRQYAAEILEQNDDQWNAARDRHADYFAKFLFEQGETLKASGNARAFDLIAQEFGNVRTAWMRLVEQREYKRIVEEILFAIYFYGEAGANVEDIVELVEIMRNALANDTRPSKGYNFAILSTIAGLVRDSFVMPYYPYVSTDSWEQFVKADDGGEPTFWRILILINYMWNIDAAGGKSRLESFLPKLREGEDLFLLANVLQALGQYMHNVHLYARAKAYLLEALGIYRKLDNRMLIAMMLRDLASIAWKEFSYQDARNMFREANEIFDSMNFWAGVSSLEHELAEVSLQEGKIREAFHHFRLSGEHAKKTGNRRLVVQNLHWTSMQALRFLDPETAIELRERSFVLANQLMIEELNGFSEWEMGEIFRVMGKLEEAQNWYDNANQIFQKYGFNMGIGFYKRGMGDISLMEGNYQKAKECFDEYKRRAGADSLNWSITYAETGLGRAAIGLGEFEAARGHLSASLKLVYQIGLRDLSMLPLLGIAMLWSAEGSHEKAAAAATYVANSFLSWNETKALARDVLAAAENSLPPEDFERAKKVGAAGMLEDVVLEFFGN